MRASTVRSRDHMFRSSGVLFGEAGGGVMYVVSFCGSFRSRTRPSGLGPWPRHRINLRASIEQKKKKGKKKEGAEAGTKTTGTKQTGTKLMGITELSTCTGVTPGGITGERNS